MGADHTFSLASFRQNFQIQVTKYEGDDMEFEMKGVSCAVSGATEPEIAERGLGCWQSVSVYAQGSLQNELVVVKGWLEWRLVLLLLLTSSPLYANNAWVCGASRCKPRHNTSCSLHWTGAPFLSCLICAALLEQMANSLRRIMIAEVPTMAIEHVFIINNTSIIQVSQQTHTPLAAMMAAAQSLGPGQRCRRHMRYWRPLAMRRQLVFTPPNSDPQHGTIKRGTRRSVGAAPSPHAHSPYALCVKHEHSIEPSLLLPSLANGAAVRGPA